MDRQWHLLDAKDQILGRLATKTAVLLMGKHKPEFVRYRDQGDYVVIINAGLVAVTGGKEIQKQYKAYSGYPSGLKLSTLAEVRQKKPARLIQNAVKGMLPKNKLLNGMLKRLKVSADDQHAYEDKFKSQNSKPTSKS